MILGIGGASVLVVGGGVGVVCFCLWTGKDLRGPDGWGRWQEAEVGIGDPEGMACIEKEMNSLATGGGMVAAEVGLPYMSNPRRRAIERAGKLSVSELVEDVGDVQTSLMFVDAGSYVFNVYDEIALSVFLPRNAEVVRLIEEGRRNPALVGNLLAGRIRGLLQTFPGLYRGAQGLPEETFYSESGQAAVGRYLHEAYAATASLYILLNIDYPETPEVLAEIIRHPMPNGMRIVESRGLLVWACAMCVRKYADAGIEGVEALLDEQADLLGPLAEPGAIDLAQQVSPWNTPWTVDSHLLAMAGADVSKFPTMEVYGIPPIDSGLHPGKGPLGPSAQIAILENYAKLAEKMGW